MSRHAVRPAVVLFAVMACAAAAAGLPGCAVEELAQVGEEPRAAISYAATATYPGHAVKSPRMELVAFDHPDRNVLEVHNLMSRSVPASSVWVNENFVARVGPIPPRGFVAVKYSDLLESGPGVSDLDRLDAKVAKVELHTDEGLFTVMGPATK